MRKHVRASMRRLSMLQQATSTLRIWRSEPVELEPPQLGATIVRRCRCRIILSDSDALRGAVLAHPRFQLLGLDVTEVSNIDAAGLGLLVTLRKCADAKRARLRLLNVTGRVNGLLSLTNLTPILECSIRDLLSRAIHQPSLETVFLAIASASLPSLCPPSPRASITTSGSQGR